MNDTTPDDGTPRDGSDAALALDFALGTLGGDELRAAELRLRRDPAFAAEVAAWQRDLAPLADAVAPVAPSRSVWAAVDAELFRSARMAVPADAPRASFWSGLAVWRSLAAGTSAIAAVALGLLVTRPDAAPAPAPVPVTPVRGELLAASMASTAKTAEVLLTATWDPDRGAVILTPSADNSSKGKTPELWLIVGDEAPRSLGLIDLRGAQSHPIPEEYRKQLQSGASLAISLEPPGGSPTGAPTGPIVAVGKLSAI